MINRLSPFLIGALLLLVAFPAGVARASDDGDWVGKKAPDFSLQDLDGKPLKLGDYVGKKVLWLNFWGLRCGPCVRELPALQSLYSKYNPKGLVIIGVNTDGVDAAMIKKQFAERADLKSAGVKFPLATDADFKTIDAYALMGAPLNVMIDKKGVIQFRHEGYEEGDEVKYAKVVERLLAE